MGRRRRPKFDAGAFDTIIHGVKTLYREKVRPLEEQYMVKDFHYPLLNDCDFDARPMILLIGSYSTGKTSFIRFLLERVGCRITDSADYLLHVPALFQ